MIHLIEYDRIHYGSDDEHTHEIIFGWDEKEALLNFYEQHCDNGRHPVDYYTHERELLSKMFKPLNIDECIYILNSMLSGCLKITGVYKNLESVYVTDTEA